MTPLGPILGVDPGDRRTGVAVSDPNGRVAVAVETIEHRSEAEATVALARIGRDRGVVRVVCGLPLNMDGTEGPRAARARAFGERLGDALGVPVAFHDERLTSWEAKETLKAAGVHGRRRRAAMDRVAAVLILQGWLDRQSAPG